MTPGPQSDEGLCQLCLVTMAPNELCPLLGILVPRRPEQPLELTQIYVAENVGRARLPGPPVSQSPQR